jgi:hypothetical protein
MDESIDVEPLIASMLKNKRSFSLLGPDSANDGFGPHTLLILRPELNGLLGVLLLDLSDDLRELIF